MRSITLPLHMLSYPYTLTRQVNDGRTSTSSLKCILFPIFTDIPPTVGVPDISHGITSRVTLGGIDSVVRLGNRQAMRLQSGFLRLAAATVDTPHVLAFSDLI